MSLPDDEQAPTPGLQDGLAPREEDDDDDGLGNVPSPTSFDELFVESDGADEQETAPQVASGHSQSWKIHHSSGDFKYTGSFPLYGARGPCASNLRRYSQ